jgi:hypothetical protein
LEAVRLSAAMARTVRTVLGSGGRKHAPEPDYRDSQPDGRQHWPGKTEVAGEREIPLVLPGRVAGHRLRGRLWRVVG